MRFASTEHAARHTIARIAAAALLAAAGPLAGCVSDASVAEALVARANAAEASEPLGGEALVQRKLELERAFRDLTHFNTTLDSLHRRGDRSGLVMFSEFVEHFLAKHTLALLAGDWQSRHPEVAVHDVNVRLAVAELWFKLGAGGGTDAMLDEIERRYAGRSDMVITYPTAVGQQGTLRDAVARLRDRSWWNG